MKLRETQISSKTIHQGKFLTVKQDVVRLPDGQKGQRFYVEHPGAAVVIPEIKKGSYLMVQQFRYAVGQTFWEFPAGKRDGAERFLKTAMRELAEETGYQSKKIKKLGSTYPCIGYANELIEVYWAQNLVSVGQNLDAGEFLNLKVFTYQQIQTMIKKGQLTDGKSLAAWCLYLTK